MLSGAPLKNFWRPEEFTCNNICTLNVYIYNTIDGKHAEDITVLLVKVLCVLKITKESFEMAE